MRVESYHVIHYGVDYLPWSLRSVYDQVDRLNIFFTPHPSHGHGTNAPPPETRQQLFDAAYQYDPQGKIYWYDVDHIWNEGQQRDYAVAMCQHNGAQIIVVCDYDEIWHDYVLDRALSHVRQTNGARNWLVNMVHFWKSFNFACRDANWPVRIIDTRHQGGTGYVDKEFGDIYHFGYAITNRVMSYKMQIHGHRNELRPNWYEKKWQAWPPVEDCHPTNGRKEDGTGWWNPEPFDKRTLPALMRGHPFYDLERID